MLDNLEAKIKELCKNRKEIRVLDVINALNLEDNRKMRDNIRRLFKKISEEDEFFILEVKSNTYILKFDEERYKKYLDKKKKEALLKEKERIIKTFLKEVENGKEKFSIRVYNTLKCISDKKIKYFYLIKSQNYFILLDNTKKKAYIVNKRYRNALNYVLEDYYINNYFDICALLLMSDFILYFAYYMEEDNFEDLKNLLEVG